MIIMPIARRVIQYALLIPIVVLILICSLSVQKAAGNSSTNAEEIASINYELPIYKISISETTQREIEKLCEKEHLSYELVLAIYQVEGIDSARVDDIKADIGKLVYFRDYWTEKGFPDESVFNLMLLSNQRGIEGCITFMEDNHSYELDSYVQKVTEYKYYLEESLDHMISL